MRRFSASAPILIGGLSLLGIPGFSLPAMAQWAPVPERRYEPPPPPPPPGARMAWQSGAWDWDGRGYVWRPGHYVGWRPAYHTWIPGHWSRRGYHQVWIPPHWR